MTKIRALLGDQLIDTHCHISDESYDAERVDALNDAKNQGIVKVIDIAIDIPSSLRTLASSQKYAEIIPAVGIDPECLVFGSQLYTEIANFPEWLAQQRAQLRPLISDSQIVGECGIDTYWLYRNFRDGKITKPEMDESIEKQEQLFRMQCELAAEYGKPLSIHSRGAEQRCLNIINDYSISAIFHSFTGSLKVAKKIIDRGHFLGVNGIVTYTSAEDLRNLYRTILGNGTDLNPGWFYDRQVVFETDAPFLFPFDSSRRNYPAQVKVIYDFMTKLITN